MQQGSKNRSPSWNRESRKGDTSMKGSRPSTISATMRPTEGAN